MQTLNISTSAVMCLQCCILLFMEALQIYPLWYSFHISMQWTYNIRDICMTSVARIWRLHTRACLMLHIM